jgi:soluble lytic murein transglycosylase-like protein
MKYSKEITPHRRITLPSILGVFNAFLLLIVLLAFGVAANAQTAVSASPTTKASPEVAADPAKSYIDSLKHLSELYEQDAQRLAQENEKLKQLYADGIIARVELEKSDQSLADARARVDATQKQIAEALKPKPAVNVTADSANGFTNQSWTTGSITTDNLIRYYSKLNGLDPYLVFCLMNQESGFVSRITSPKGAQGLMQLMPDTAARYGVTNPFDAAQSISAGARYLKDLLQMFNGRLDLALAGYNAGEGAVIKYGYKIPPYSETQNYVRLIVMRYQKKGAVTKKI